MEVHLVGKDHAVGHSDSDSSTRDAVTLPLVPGYELRARIGQGASGEVWLARNEVTGSWHAVKVVYRTHAEPNTFDHEFDGIRSYEPISRSDPALMSILHVGSNEEASYFYYVMELADPIDSSAPEEVPNSEIGRNINIEPAVHVHSFSDLSRPETYKPRTLRSDLSRCPRLNVLKCVDLAIALTSALDALHRFGLLHRDIKPSNIIYVKGRPKLADIGLVKFSDATFSFVGTPGYNAPEGPSSCQADIYSLGILLYEASAGKNRKYFPDPPTGLSAAEEALWAELNEVVLKACKTNRLERYSSADLMRKDLELLRSGHSLRRLRMVEGRLRTLKRISAALALIGLLSTAGLLYQRHVSATIRLLASESHERLVRLNVSQGLDKMQRYDLFESLAWFTKALELDAADPVAASNDRLRIESVRRECPRLVGFGMHKASILYSEFAPDSQKIVTASEDGTARVWDAQTSQPVSGPLVHDGFVIRAVFSPNGKRIATVSMNDDNSSYYAQVWDADTGSVIGKPLKHSKEIVHVVFNPDGNAVLTSSKDGSAVLWDFSTGKRLISPLKHSGTVLWAAFSPDGATIATASEDKTCKLWNARTGEFLNRSFSLGSDVNQVSFSPDGSRLLTASDDGPARVWLVANGQPVTPPLHFRGRIRSSCFSADGNHVLIAGGLQGQSGSANIWDARTGELVNTISSPQQNIFSSGTFSPDGRWLLLISDRAAQLLDAEHGDRMAPILRQGEIISASFAGDGRRILTSGKNGTWRLWDLVSDGLKADSAEFEHTIEDAKFDNTGERILARERSAEFISRSRNRAYVLDTRNIGSTNLFVEHQNRMTTAFSPDGRFFVTSSFDGTGRAWDAISCRPISPILSCFSSLGVSPDSRIVVTVSTNSATNFFAELWRASDWTHLIPPLPQKGGVERIAFSPDGRFLAISTRVGQDHFEVQVSYSGTAQPSSSPIVLNGWVKALSFSPDSTLLLTACSPDGLKSGSADLWDVRTSRHVFSMPHDDGLSDAQFSPDGRRIATASEDRTARIWDIQTSLAMGRPMTHKRTVIAVAFSPDGSKIVTGSHDGTARIWDARTGEPLTSALQCGGMARSVAFHPSGKKILVASGNWSSTGQLHLWQLPENQHESRDLLDCAEVLSGGRLDENAVFAQAEPTALLNKWKRLKMTHREDFTVSPESQFEWHESQAESAQSSGKIPAARFHWEQCLKIRDDSNISEHLKQTSLESISP